MQEENLSPEQSLKLIQSMINKTKQDMSDNGIYFLVWGWLLSLPVRVNSFSSMFMIIQGTTSCGALFL